jgi:hypothetical protein
MPRGGLAYEKPSRVSQGLIVSFSVAVVIMAGWLVMTIMSSRDANTMAADPADIPPVSTPASTPPRVLMAAPEPIRLSSRSTAPSTASPPGPAPWPYSSAATPPPAALPLAAAPVGAPPPAPTYSTSSVRDAMADANDRVTPGDQPAPEAAIEAPEAAAEAVPLPPPKPRRVASIPVPRPRPRVDGDDAPPQERSFFDQLFNPQR